MKTLLIILLILVSSFELMARPKPIDSDTLIFYWNNWRSGYYTEHSNISGIVVIEDYKTVITYVLPEGYMRWDITELKNTGNHEFEININRKDKSHGFIKITLSKIFIFYNVKIGEYFYRDNVSLNITRTNFDYQINSRILEQRISLK
jgi:hypothetical protein